MWILNTIAATLLLSLSTIFLKCKTKRTDASVVTALRTLIVAIFMWIALLTDDKVSSLSSVSGDDWLYLLLTALAMTIGLICYHISLKNGSATGVTALSRSVQLIIIFENHLYYTDCRRNYVGYHQKTAFRRTVDSFRTFGKYCGFHSVYI